MTCRQCTAEFTPRKGGRAQVFCSRPCQERWHEKRDVVSQALVDAIRELFGFPPLYGGG